MKNEITVFGGGCFWCLDPLFLRLKGVESVTVGYTGGKKENPTYKEVCSGRTGYAEVIKVEYDPAIISYDDLLNVFFSMHDPTTPNRQGQDVGPQYRSTILYIGDKQKTEAENFIKKLTEDKIHPAPIVTEIKPLQKFWRAEEYHQRYFEKNPEKAYCQLLINPKVDKLREKFKHLLKYTTEQG